MKLREGSLAAAMKRFKRLLLLTMPVAGIVILAAGIAGLAPVRLDPDVHAAWREATRTRLEALDRETLVARGPLRAGFGRSKLTPSLGGADRDPEGGVFPALPLAGYGDRKGRPAEGVLDDVWVKAVALSVGSRTGVVVAADALIIPRDVAETAVSKVAETVGLRREQIYFGATHTHCSLGGWGQGPVGEAFAGPFEPGVRTWFAGRLAAAIQQAVNDLQPAALGTGAFQARSWVRNRLVGDLGPVDAGFHLIRVRQSDGDEGVMGTFGAHATVMGSRAMQFSADYPGVWQRAIERERGGMAMFLAGAVGSQSPRPPKGGAEGAVAMGEALAAETLSLLKEIALSDSVTFGWAAVEADLPELQNRLTDGVRLRPWLARRLLPPLAPGTWLQAMRVQEAVWCSTPCDYSGELALDLQGVACRLGLDAAVTSFNGDYVGYVIPGKYYHLDGYEPRVMSFYGPNLPDYFDGILRRLVTALGRPEKW